LESRVFPLEPWKACTACSGCANSNFYFGRFCLATWPTNPLWVPEKHRFPSEDGYHCFSQHRFQNAPIVIAMFATNEKTASRRSALIHQRSRGGAAAVEAALCIPLIILLMFGTLEISAGYYLQESVTIAAYEGARQGARRRGTSEQVISRVEEILEARNVQLGSGTITVTPTDLTTLDAVQPLTVTVQVQSAGNGALFFDTMANRTITGSVTIAREFDN